MVMTDIKDFDAKILEDILKFSQGYPSNTKLDCSKIVEDWYVNKQRFIQMFDGHVTIETEELITVQLDKDTRKEKINMFYEYIRMTYVNYYECFAISQFNFLEFLKNNEEGIFSNTVISPYESTYIKVPTGMKLTRALKFFITNKDVLDDIQTALSRLIQQTKLTGKLCLSVHPLDYLSVSENASNWRSCHALDGDYRAGNLSYMVDKNTLVAYLKSEDEEVILPNFPPSIRWNNKKWRMLLFISDAGEAMFAGRHYPFFSKDLMDRVKDVYCMFEKKELIRNNWYFNTITWTDWRNEEVNSYKFKDGYEMCFQSPYIPIKNKFTKKKSIIRHNSDEDLFYNDLLYSSFYTPYYAWRTRPWSDEKLYFSIGSEKITCPCCQNRILKYHDMMVCEECDEKLRDYKYCVECGARFPQDNMIYISSMDAYVCESCYENYYTRCAHCGEIIHNDNANWCESIEDYVCEDCLNDLQAEEEY